MTIKDIIYILFFCFLAVSCVSNTQEEKDNFEFYYSYAGLGSALGSKGPVFKVNGTFFTMTKEQNSFLGEQTLSPDTLCIGEIKQSIIDSALFLIKDYKVDSVYRTNPSIISGGIHHVSIHNDTTNLSFTLHNASHPLAVQLINLFNQDIPKDCYQLWLISNNSEVNSIKNNSQTSTPPTNN